jgi:oligopeptide transport system permease protein
MIHLRWQWVWIVSLATACAMTLLLPDSIALEQNISLRHAAPNAAHWLGTDMLGRDLLIRLLCGARVSLAVGLGATALALAMGTAVGMAAGYLGGIVDCLLMNLVNVLHALPLTLFVLLLPIFFGRGIVVLCVSIGMVEWLTLARVVRARTLELRGRTFIQSAIGLGQSRLGILRLHIFPNVRPLIGRYVLILLPNAILMEAFLSFLGLGVPPPLSSWGSMIMDAVPTMGIHPAQMLLPSALLLITLLAFSTLRPTE